MTPGFADARGAAPDALRAPRRRPRGLRVHDVVPGRRRARAAPPPPARRPLRRGAREGRAPRAPRASSASPSARARGRSTGRASRAPRAPDGTRAFLDARADAAANARRPRLRGTGPRPPRPPRRGARRVAEPLASASPAARGSTSPSPARSPRRSSRRSTARRSRSSGRRRGRRSPGLVPRPSGSLLVVSPAPAGPVAETDLLVPALVGAAGANGARYATVLTVGNALGDAAPPRGAPPRRRVGAVPARGPRPLEPLVRLRRRSSRRSGRARRPSPAAPARRLGRAPGPSSPRRASSTRRRPGPTGSRSPSFPAGSERRRERLRRRSSSARGTPSTERMNVSLFAPFEASAADVAVLDAAGRAAPHAPRRPRRRSGASSSTTSSPGEAPGDAVRVTVLAGRVQVYGTVVSNAATNDPWRVPALPLAGAATAWTVPAVASAEGRNGAFFRSDLFLFAPAGATRRRDAPPARRERRRRRVRLTLRPGSPASSPTSSRRSSPRRRPAPERSSSRPTAPFLPLAVTRSDAADGPFLAGPPVRPRGAEAAPGRPVAFAGVDESPAARSNLVLVAAGGPSRVRLVLLASGRRPRGELDVELGAGRVVQLDSVRRRSSPAEPSRARPSSSCPRAGPVVASVARIDNATNDPAGLAPAAGRARPEPQRPRPLLLPLRRLEEERGPEEVVPGVEERDADAGAPVEEAPLQDPAAEELQRRTEEEGEDAPPRAAVEPVEGREPRVERRLPDARRRRRGRGSGGAARRARGPRRPPRSSRGPGPPRRAGPGTAGRGGASGRATSRRAGPAAPPTCERRGIRKPAAPPGDSTALRIASARRGRHALVGVEDRGPSRAWRARAPGCASATYPSHGIASTRAPGRPGELPRAVGRAGVDDEDLVGPRRPRRARARAGRPRPSP